MQRIRPVGNILLVASVLSTLAIGGCKTGVDGQPNSSSDAPIALKQVAGPADLNAESVVSAAKSSRGIDPRSLEQSAPPPPKTTASPPAGAKPGQPVGPMKVIGIVTPNGIEPLPKTQVKERPVNPAPPAAAANDVLVEKFNTDLAKVESLEKALYKFNLKLLTVTDRGQKYIDWDQALMDRYDGSIGEALPALKRYHRAVDRFLSTYDRQLTVDGSRETYRKMSSNLLDVLISKLRIVESTIEYIEKHQEDADDSYSGVFESFFA